VNPPAPSCICGILYRNTISKIKVCSVLSRRVRQEDIAKKLGLSINTVSLALKDSKRINEETRMKVQQLASKLNYIPNSIARSLVQKKTNMIGFILPRITNPIHIETAQLMERKLSQKGYNMILMTTSSDENYEARALDILFSYQVDGIFLFPTNKKDQVKIKAIRDAHYPIVLLSGGSFNMASDAVYMNQYLGTYHAATHLAMQGHKRIAFINEGSTNTEKYRGYTAALKENQLEFDPDLIIPVKSINYEEGYNAALRLFASQSATAILASSDVLAVGALRWCRERAISVPEDVAIIGFDDLEIARYAEVPLTSMAYKADELTSKAMDVMFGLIENKEKLTSLTPVRIEIEPSLVIRESCGYKKSNRKQE
jgi:LacI family transcriptional regulator